MKLATSEDMKKIDELAVKEHSLTISQLMESAGAAVVEGMEDFFGTLTPKTFGVVCGRGHNGGDGLVVARLLKKKKASVVAVLAADPEDLSEETHKQYLQVKSAKIPVLITREKQDLARAEKRPEGIVVTRLMSCRFVPLIGTEAFHKVAEPDSNYS